MTESKFEIVERAGRLWREQKFAEARTLYEQIYQQQNLSPIDKAKMLANVAQIWRDEGYSEKAIEYGYRTISELAQYELYKKPDGSHLFGFMRGMLNRLQDKPQYGILDFVPGLPIVEHLSPIHRVCAHFAVGVTGAVIGAEVTQLMPPLDFKLLSGTSVLISFSVIAFLIGMVASHGLLERMAEALAQTFNSSPYKMLLPAVKLTITNAVLCILASPQLLHDMVPELIFFILTSGIGLAYFTLFLLPGHCSEVQPVDKE